MMDALPIPAAALLLLSLSACGPKADSASSGTPRQLCINEFMASNAETVQDEKGAWPDWIELYNSSAEPISLDGVFLTDDLASPQKAALDPSLVVQGGSYLLLWADNDTTDGIYHLPFSLKAEGESLGLSWLDGEALYLVDSLNFGAQETDISAARIPDGTDTWANSDTPTPGSTNR